MPCAATGGNTAPRAPDELMNAPEDALERYLVGGAVRDELLGLPRHDRDWVVIGATPERMCKLGFKQVGKSFPVFLHPKTGEHYALARTERKAGRGHRGFAFNAAPGITLKEDLARRDLSINAIARTTGGDLIDPFGGCADLEQRVLRHVTGHFTEDPLRVLRVARFLARYTERGFHVAPATLELMRNMVNDGEVDELSPERVWMELVAALGESTPSAFFGCLRECDALARVFPEVDGMFGVPQPTRHHPEGDTGKHVMMALDQAARITADPVTRFAVLTHDFGKALTPRSQWPRHVGHERSGLQPIRNLCTRLRAPRLYMDTALKVCHYHLLMHRFTELRPLTIVDTLGKLDAFRSPDNATRFAEACEADVRGRSGRENDPYPQRQLLLECLQAARGVDGKATLAAAPDKHPAQAIRRAREQAVRETLRRNS